MSKTDDEIEVEEEILKKKRLHYGNIHDCPMAQMLITTRMLDKVRRLIRLEYLKQVDQDLGDIPEVKKRVGDSHQIVEDTLIDLKNYIILYEEGLIE
jgi:aminoglycoside phosphotransferase